MDICAVHLKPGDKVDGHELGWMTVRHIEKYRYCVSVEYDTSSGNTTKTYFNGEKVFCIPA